MFKKFYNPIIIFSCIVVLLIFNVGAVLAIPKSLELQSGKFGLTETADQSGFNVATTVDDAPTIASIIGDIVGMVLSLLGVLFMILIIYSGFLWMTARGNEENSQKAKAIMFNAVIGVVIIFSAYAITDFIITNLYSATLGT